MLFVRSLSCCCIPVKLLYPAPDVFVCHHLADRQIVYLSLSCCSSDPYLAVVCQSNCSTQRQMFLSVIILLIVRLFICRYVLFVRSLSCCCIPVKLLYPEPDVFVCHHLADRQIVYLSLCVVRQMLILLLYQSNGSNQRQMFLSVIILLFVRLFICHYRVVRQILILLLYQSNCSTKRQMFLSVIILLIVRLFICHYRVVRQILILLLLYQSNCSTQRQMFLSVIILLIVRLFICRYVLFVRSLSCCCIPVKLLYPEPDVFVCHHLADRQIVYLSLCVVRQILILLLYTSQIALPSARCFCLSSSCCLSDCLSVIIVLFVRSLSCCCIPVKLLYQAPDVFVCHHLAVCQIVYLSLSCCSSDPYLAVVYQSNCSTQRQMFLSVIILLFVRLFICHYRVVRQILILLLYASQIALPSARCFCLSSSCCLSDCLSVIIVLFVRSLSCCCTSQTALTSARCFCLSSSCCSSDCLSIIIVLHPLHCSAFR